MDRGVEQPQQAGENEGANEEDSRDPEESLSESFSEPTQSATSESESLSTTSVTSTTSSDISITTSSRTPTSTLPPSTSPTSSPSTRPPTSSEAPPPTTTSAFRSMTTSTTTSSSTRAPRPPILRDFICRPGQLIHRKRSERSASRRRTDKLPLLKRLLPALFEESPTSSSQPQEGTWNSTPKGQQQSASDRNLQEQDLGTWDPTPQGRRQSTSDRNLQEQQQGTPNQNLRGQEEGNGTNSAGRDIASLFRAHGFDLTLNDQRAMQRWAAAKKVPESPSDEYLATSRAITFGTRHNYVLAHPQGVAVGNLYGCTALIVVSTRGIYLAKFYENAMTGALTAGEQDRLFQHDVLDFLGGFRRSQNNIRSRAVFPGLRQYAAKGGAGSRMFTENDSVRVLIVSPEDPDGSQGLQYADYVEKMEQIVSQMLPDNAMYETFTYPRVEKLDGFPGSRDQEKLNDYVEGLGRTAYGKVIVEYKSDGYAAWVMRNERPELYQLW